MRRMSIPCRISPLTKPGCPDSVLCGIRRNFFRLSPCCGQVPYVLLTRAPVAGRSKQAYSPAAPRLACVKPAASVHPEPGSNSSLLLILLFFFSEIYWRRNCGVSLYSRSQAEYSVYCLGRKIDRVETFTVSHSCTTFVSCCHTINVLFAFGLIPNSSAKLRRITLTTKLLFKF